MMRNVLDHELHRRRINRQRIWFQQDGASAHTSWASLTKLRHLFPGHVISLRGDVAWPPRSPRSPDLAPCDYFLWGYIKSKVYIKKPRTVLDLKEATRREVEAVPRQMVQQVMSKLQDRLHECVRRNGHHLEDAYFIT